MDFCALFTAIPTPYVVLDCDLHILAANPAYLSATGRSLSELLGEPLFTAFPPQPQAVDDDGRLPVELALRHACSTGRSVTLPAFRYDIADPTTGMMSERHWMLSIAPVLDCDGTTALLVQRTEDVTDFVAVRDRARLAQQRGDMWRERFEQVEADVFALAQELAATLKERERAAQQAATLAEVALALVAADTVEDVERELFARGLHALGADGGALVTFGGDGAWRLVADAALGEHVRAECSILPSDSPLPVVWSARHGQRLLSTPRVRHRLHAGDGAGVRGHAAMRMGVPAAAGPGPRSWRVGSRLDRRARVHGHRAGPARRVRQAVRAGGAAHRDQAR